MVGGEALEFQLEVDQEGVREKPNNEPCQV